MSKIIVKTFSAPPISKKEILRYAKTQTPTAEILRLLDESLKECERVAEYKVCYTVFPTENCQFLSESKDLSKNLCSCKSVCIFAATLGVGVDRLINKYSRISPAKAVMIDAIFSERIEGLCDEFAKSFGVKTTPRFSAGYGDLKLEKQKEIFDLLSPQKNIGLTLNESLTMSPSKSVTAFMGLKDVQYEF